MNCHMCRRPARYARIGTDELYCSRACRQQRAALIGPEAGAAKFIPRELRLQILLDAEPEEIYHMAGVNKEWRRTAEDPAVQRHIRRTIISRLGLIPFDMPYRISDLRGYRSGEAWYWGRHGLSSDPAITPEFVERHLDEPWDWEGSLSSNPAITPEFVERHLDKPWNWGEGGLSSNPAITPEFVERHLDKPWEWGMFGLSSNESITPEFIARHLDRHWHWGLRGLSQNDAMTVQIANKFFPDQPWWREYLRDEAKGHPLSQKLDVEPSDPNFWQTISTNSNITPRFVMLYIDQQWHIRALLYTLHRQLWRIEVKLRRLSVVKRRMDEALLRYHQQDDLALELYTARMMHDLVDAMDARDKAKTQYEDLKREHDKLTALAADYAERVHDTGLIFRRLAKRAGILK